MLPAAFIQLSCLFAQMTARLLHMAQWLTRWVTGSAIFACSVSCHICRNILPYHNGFFSVWRRGIDLRGRQRLVACRAAQSAGSICYSANWTLRIKKPALRRVRCARSASPLLHYAHAEIYP